MTLIEDVQDALARAWFAFCRAIGLLIRSARYSRARFVVEGGELRVRKWRAVYAPSLIWMGDRLMRALDTGVRVLPQRDWEEHERRVYASVYGKAIAVAGDGILLLPVLAGRPLASLLQDPQITERLRTKAIEHAVVALAALHRAGITHADAMADNVLVDLDAGVAHWFDFETRHDSTHPIEWQRADDLRAFLTTCLVRTARARRGEVLDLILDRYTDEEVRRVAALNFDSVWRRALPFHLAQSGLSFESFREVRGLMKSRSPAKV